MAPPLSPTLGRMKNPRPVTLVGDTEFGERIKPYASYSDVWAVDSPLNELAAKSIWGAKGEYEGSVTIFHRYGNTPDEWLGSVMDDIEEHHGIGYQNPPYDRLLVIADMTGPQLLDSLAFYGFIEKKGQDDGVLFFRHTHAQP